MPHRPTARPKTPLWQRLMLVYAATFTALVLVHIWLLNHEGDGPAAAAVSGVIDAISPPAFLVELLTLETLNGLLVVAILASVLFILAALAIKFIFWMLR
jgi:hypothetical protein